MLSVHWGWGCAEFKGSPSIDIDILSHVILCKNLSWFSFSLRLSDIL